MCLFVSLANDSLETVEVIIVKLGTDTDSDMGMHHVLLILTLPFIQGHTDLNHENNQCSIISETVQAMPIKFAVKIVWLKVYYDHCQSNDLDLHVRSQVRLKLDFLTCNISDNIEAISITISLLHSNLPQRCIAYILMLVLMTLTLLQGHSGSAKAKIQCWIISTTKQALLNLQYNGR